MRAFHGDEAMQHDVAARIRRHAEAGTLSFGATCWDGTGGSVLGVSAESADSADYAERFGFPLAMAGLLDPVVAYDGERSVEIALEWTMCVRPGADLTGVPIALLEDLLDRLDAPGRVPDHHAQVIALQRSHARGDTVARLRWASVRQAIEQAAADADTDADDRHVLDALARACWPLATSRSTLLEVIEAWIATPDPAGRFGAADRQRAEAMLNSLWEETAPRRDAGEAVSIPALFRARDPDLASRFEDDLQRSNDRILRRRGHAADLVLAHLAAASTAPAA